MSCQILISFFPFGRDLRFDESKKNRSIKSDAEGKVRFYHFANEALNTS